MKHLLTRHVAGFFLLLLSFAGVAQTPPAFEAEIRAFEASDLVSKPPQNSILFTGSSSIRLWKDLSGDFPNKAVLNRGFGGSQLSDVLRYADRIIIPYKPRQIILYAGENDIATGNLSAQETFNRFVTLFTHIRKALPKTPFVFISIKPSPSRRKFQLRVIEANRLIKEYLKKQKRTTYVDVYTPMLTTSGQMRGELFGPDSLHMNRKGYEIWREILRPVVK